MRDKTDTTASAFISTLYGPGSHAPVFVCALPNERGGHREQHVLTRDGASIDGFVAKWDRPGTAIYFSVGTLKRGAQPLRPGGSVRCKDNVAEIVTLQADIDLKSVDLSREQIESALLALEMPPSILVWSGRGWHAYWLLNEPVEADADTNALIETLNAQVADVVGGDPVGDVCRLMRLPGSHNTKDGSWLPVELAHARWQPRYELVDLEDWLARQSPAIRRKTSVRAVAGIPVADNPWLAVAAHLGFKPPLDVEKRLAQMSYQGVGDASIHNTQLAVSAALLQRGSEIEEVVAILVEATRAAVGPDGGRWRWDREETTIRRMCQDWIRKHPEIVTRAATAKADSLQTDASRKAQAKQMDRGDSLSENAEGIREATTGAVVHRLSEERQKRERGKRKRGEGAPVHIVLGEAVLEAMRQRGQAILFMRKAAWIYENGLWSMEVDGLKNWLDVQIETACRALNIDGTNRVRSEARGYIQASPDLWRDDVAWDAHGRIPTRSGLVDIQTGIVEPARADHYCTWRVEADYDPDEACPLWVQMASDTFADRGAEGQAQIVDALQEILGCAFVDVKPRALSKALCLVGGSNFGKSGILEVFGGMFGDNAITAGLESLEGSHGLMPFTRRAPWVLHEAFDQRKWHFSSTVKAIVTSEPVSINVKNGPILTQRVRSPIFWGTNHPPQFREATRAIVNRLIVIHCRREFFEGQFVGVAAEARKRGLDRPSTLVLAVERSGILNWAIAGLRRALELGAILVNDEIRGNAEDIHRDSNLVAGFIEECVGFDHERRVSVPDFCAAFSVWWLENKGEDRSIPSNDSIGKNIAALGNARIASDPKETKDKSRRYLCGIMLNEDGLSFWERAKEAKVFEGKTASVEASVEKVNGYTPETWFSRPALDRMRRAHADDTSGRASVTSCPRSVTFGSSVTNSGVTPEASPALSPDQASPTYPIDPLKEPQF